MDQGRKLLAIDDRTLDLSNLLVLLNLLYFGKHSLILLFFLHHFSDLRLYFCITRTLLDNLLVGLVNHPLEVGCEFILVIFARDDFLNNNSFLYDFFFYFLLAGLWLQRFIDNHFLLDLFPLRLLFLNNFFLLDLLVIDCLYDLFLRLHCLHLLH